MGDRFCTDPNVAFFFSKPLHLLVHHQIPMFSLIASPREVQLIDFGRSASKAALTGPCGEAFRAGHVPRLTVGGGPPGSIVKPGGEERAIIVGNLRLYFVAVRNWVVFYLFFVSRGFFIEIFGQDYILI